MVEIVLLVGIHTNITNPGSRTQSSCVSAGGVETEIFREKSMITSDQVQLAETSWLQAREAADHADASWRLVMQSLESLRESYMSAGHTFTGAAEAFDKLME